MTTQGDTADTAATRLRRGSRVRVADPAAILATLDENGRLDGLPFMPEMLKWAGDTLEVSARADKSCDTIEFDGRRRMHGAVHLTGTRCDGSAHGGCQAGCLLFWKEEWLRPADEEPAAAEPVDEAAMAALAASTHGEADGRERYWCQATELRAATTHLPWWGPGQYVRDVRSGHVAPARFAHGLAVWAFNMYQALSKRVLPARLRFRKGRWYPFIIGTATTTERPPPLDLQPGELVEVKSFAEIRETLDEDGRNRGLSFDGEMTPYCGRRFRVLRRVERILDERTGVMLRLPKDCLVLDNVVCQGIYHLFCPRAIYPYWREAWLRRVE